MENLMQYSTKERKTMSEAINVENWILAFQDGCCAKKEQLRLPCAREMAAILERENSVFTVLALLSSFSFPSFYIVVETKERWNVCHAIHINFVDVKNPAFI